MRCGKDGRLAVDVDGDGPETMDRLSGDAPAKAGPWSVTFRAAREDDIRMTPLKPGQALGILRPGKGGDATWRFGAWASPTGATEMACRGQAAYRRSREP